MQRRIEMHPDYDTDYEQITKSNPRLRKKIEKQLRFLGGGEPWHPSLNFEFRKDRPGAWEFKIWVDKSWRIFGVLKDDVIELYGLEPRENAYR